MIRSATYLLWVCSIILLSGCASPSKVDLANPTPIHKQGYLPDEIDGSNLEHKAIQASTELAFRYYDALETAKSDSATQAQIDAYVREGSNLVETHCVRWFSALSDAQRNLEFSESNRNVISQLGTALIGIGRLHSDVTAVYGATNVALAGFSENTNAAFLVAPNSENVKQLIMQAVKSRAALLEDSNSPLHPTDFSTAYAELEQLADLCTYAEAKHLATQAIDKSEAAVNESTGQVFVVSAASKVQATLKDRVESLVTKVDSLNMSQALTLSSVMPFKNDPAVSAVVSARDPEDLRFTDENVAKRISKMVLVLTAKSECTIAKWETVLKQFN